MKHNDVFELTDKFSLRALYTPGHAVDHFSMLLTNPSIPETYLFSGDIILGTPSTTVQDLDTYMKTLYNLRKEEFSHICLPHSVNLNPD